MSLRAPRVRVLADDVPLPGVLETDVFANNHLAADRFRVRLAASVSNPAALAAPGLRLEVQVSLGTGWTGLILGVAEEGYDLFLDGGTLHFHPTGTEAAVVLGPRDCLGLRLEQSLALSRGAEVTVRSWNARRGGSARSTTRPWPTRPRASSARWWTRWRTPSTRLSGTYGLPERGTCSRSTNG